MSILTNLIGISYQFVNCKKTYLSLYPIFSPNIDMNSNSLIPFPFIVFLENYSLQALNPETLISVDGSWLDKKKGMGEEEEKEEERGGSSLVRSVGSSAWDRWEQLAQKD